MIWHKIPSKFRKPLLFVLGGGANTAFTYAIYLILNIWLNYQQAYFLAYFLGILIAYSFNTVIVFKASLSWRGLFSYPLVYITQYAVSALILGALVGKIEISPTLAPLLVTIIMLPATYTINKLIIEWAGIKGIK